MMRAMPWAQKIKLPAIKIFSDVGKAVDVEQERLLHVCGASQYGTTQEALCGYAPEHERGWDFPSDLETAKLAGCPDCWNEKGAREVY